MNYLWACLHMSVHMSVHMAVHMAFHMPVHIYLCMRLHISLYTPAVSAAKVTPQEAYDHTFPERSERACL